MKASKKAGGVPGAKRKAAADPEPGARQRMQKMFQSAAMKTSRPRAVKVDDKATDALLDDILGNLDSGIPTVSPSAALASRKVVPPQYHAPASLPKRVNNNNVGRHTTTTTTTTVRPGPHRLAKPSARPLPSKKPAAAVFSRKPPSLENHPIEEEEEEAHPADNCYGDGGYDVDFGGGDGGYDDENVIDAMEVDDQGTGKDGNAPTAAGVANPRVAALKAAALGPSQESPPSPAAAATPVGQKTPASAAGAKEIINNNIITPGSAAPAGGWADMYSAAAEEGEGERADDEGAHKQQEAAPWVDDGTLPLDSESRLPFYFLDAHEEYSQPGVVYLFGKVPIGGNGQHSSCCVVVNNMQRNVFFVPRNNIEATNPDIARLATELASAAAAASSSLPEDQAASKKNLNIALHQEMSELKTEVRSLFAEHGVSQMTMKPVMRNYAFENEAVSHGKQWVLKVRYPANLPQLPLGLSGQHFSAAFGVNQSCLEALIIKRKIMGPGWLTLTKPTRVAPESGRSWCKLEVEVDNHKAVNIATGDLANTEAPQLTVAAISLKTILNTANSTNEIAAASVVYLTKVKTDRPMEPEEWNNPRHLRCFSAVRKLDGAPFPPGFDAEVKRENESPLGRANGGAMLSMQGNEKGLLIMLVARLRALDADVFVGHNIAAFDFDVLLHRLQHFKVPHWSSLGRLRRTKWPRLGGGGHIYGGGASQGAQDVMAGRLICDTYLNARDLVKEVDYTLATLSRNLLAETRSELSPSDVPLRYDTAQRLLGLVRHTSSDAYLGLRLSFYLSILPLSRQLASLSGSSWGKALAGQRAQRIEMLLLHEFHSKKFMLPDKLTNKERERLAKAAAAGERGGDFDEDDDANQPATKKAKKAKGPQYAGGLVLEPKKGLYDRCILLLDFNSLYPSIIQEYNICYTTVERPEDGSVPPLPEPGAEAAPLPGLLRTLVQRRRAVKDLLKNERNATRRSQLEIRQQALKLTANSMYGCLGFSQSRFFARPLAELITSQGREILQSTVDLVQSNVGREVVYGDTDSIMVDTGSHDLQECIRLGNIIKAQVNKRYRLLEIEMDGVFKCMLLLKKKKYAAIKLERTPDGRTVEIIETKGLDIVRRDWCPLCKDVGNFALKHILSGAPAEEVVAAIHEHLADVKDKVRAGEIPLNKFVITKQLTKRPEDYPDAKNQPHVQVALRRRAAGKRDGVAPGETVPYIIAVDIDPVTKLPTNGSGNGGEKGALADRACHPDEISSSNGAKLPDPDYYLAQQVFPVVSRLCAPIDGTDPGRLAESLGLDVSKYHTVVQGGDEGRYDALLAAASSLDDEDRYKNCQPLMLTVAKTSGTGIGGEAAAAAEEEGGDQKKKAVVETQSWVFPGLREAMKKAPDAVATAIETALLPPTSSSSPPAAGYTENTSTASVSANQLSNQVTLAARRAIASYYQGWSQSDDEVLPCKTRNICLREVEGVAPGAAPPDTRCAGVMKQEITEALLYTQLSYLHRLFDVESLSASVNSDDAQVALKNKVAPVEDILKVGMEAAAKFRDASGYRWVDLGSMFGKLAALPTAAGK
jgi:DNA polymerase alpha subunit A